MIIGFLILINRQRKTGNDMVTVRFLNLLRSKYRIEQVQVEAGTLGSILDQVLAQAPSMKKDDLAFAVLFINETKQIRLSDRQIIIKDGETLSITHFVGGG